MRSFAMLVSSSLVLVGCATTGSTFGSGVGDAFLEHPPFYAGAEVDTARGTDRVGYLPVAYQRGASQPAVFDPEESPEIMGLLADMSRYLAEAGVGVALVSPDRSTGQDAFTSADGGSAGGAGSPYAGSNPGLQPPDVRFGCVTETGMADDDCAEREGGALGRGSQPMHLSVGRPSPEWIAWSDGLMRDAGVERTLVLTLEVGQYWIRQRGLAGHKEVELGTGHTTAFPWLTSLEGPVSVIQITGALVGGDGKALRIGAEGLLARRTSMPVSILGGQALVTTDEIRDLRTARREDLPGRPLVWEAGLASLVRQLTGAKG